jgi:Protein of unknown function (DUF2934)
MYARARSRYRGRMKTTQSPESIDERIRTRAYERYLSRGGADGADVEDWIQAEQEVIDSVFVETVEADVAIPKLAAA